MSGGGVGDRGVPARLAHVEPDALAWAIGVAGGDWRRVVARGDGCSVMATPQVHRVELAPARPRPRPPSARPVAQPPAVVTGGWTFTAHALVRMRERAITMDQVLWVLADPEATWPTPMEHRHAGERTNAVRGKVMVGFDPASRVVVYVHPNNQPSAQA